ncbi:hypothetical protein BU17DRAFT_79892 [Hysterangium stoloniferum]|nr:hypothetical protein BU17DRAFT_79892 [Hysterangium stoloniferum]
MPVTVECSNPRPSLSLNVGNSAGSEGVSYSVPGYDHTDRGKGSSLQPASEHPSDLTDKEDDPSYDRQSTDGLEQNTLMDGLFNMFHMTITTSSAYNKAGRQVRLPPSLSPAFPSLVMISNNADQGCTMQMHPLAIPESTAKEGMTSTQLPAPFPEASKPEDPEGNTEGSTGAMNSFSRSNKVLHIKTTPPRLHQGK